MEYEGMAMATNLTLANSPYKGYPFVFTATNYFHLHFDEHSVRDLFCRFSFPKLIQFLFNNWQLIAYYRPDFS